MLTSRKSCCVSGSIDEEILIGFSACLRYLIPVTQEELMMGGFKYEVQ